jgi:hypothetical protein
MSVRFSGEQERLDGHVVVDVRLRREHPDLAAGRLLHDTREVVGHLLPPDFMAHLFEPVVAREAHPSRGR